MIISKSIVLWMCYITVRVQFYVFEYNLLIKKDEKIKKGKTRIKERRASK